VDVKGMVEDVFQCNDEPPTLKKKVIEIFGEVFGVANGVGEEVNGGHDHVANIGEDPIEIKDGDEVVGEFPFEDGLEPQNFDATALEDLVQDYILTTIVQN
jgi:hypothetical protein